jgi:hypothetical protein
VIYVVDTSTVIAVQVARTDTDACFIAMTGLVNESRLCFPNEVVEELERLGKDGPSLNWAKAVSNSRCHKGAPYNYTEWVLAEFGGLVDLTASATQESAAVYVAAQALQIRNNGNELAVVTEDIRDKPTRRCLLDACEHFDLPYLRMTEFLDDAQIP